MENSGFWALIRAARARGLDDLSGNLREELSSLSSEELVGFERCFIGVMDHAYHFDIWRMTYAVEHEMTEAAFFGFRAWLVAQGREAYEKLLVDPEAIIELIGADARRVPKLPGFRAVSHNLYAEQEGEPIPGRMFSVAPEAPHDEEDTDSWEAFLARHPRLTATYWGSSTFDRLQKRSQRMNTHLDPEQRRLRKRVRLVTGVVGLGGLATLIWAPWWASIFGLLLAVFGGYAGLAASLRRSREIGLESFFTARRGVGSATHLRGVVDFAVVHAGPRADASAPPALTAGLALLEQEAARHGIELQLCDRTPIPHVLSDRILRDDDSAIALPLRQQIQVAASEDPFVVQLAQRHSNFFVIVLSSEWVRACAYPRSRHAGPGLELCVVPRDADPATYAHEILHLFGARDLYREESWSELRDQTVNEVMEDLSEFIPVPVLERSIMLDEGEEVDPANAFAVGWTESLRPDSGPLPLLQTPRQPPPRATGEHLVERRSLEREALILTELHTTGQLPLTPKLEALALE